MDICEFVKTLYKSLLSNSDNEIDDSVRYGIDRAIYVLEQICIWKYDIDKTFLEQIVEEWRKERENNL